MDLRVYYQKIRKIEAELPEPFVVVVSRETPDGGKAGVQDGGTSTTGGAVDRARSRADLASPEEAAQFRGGNGMESGGRRWKS